MSVSNFYRLATPGILKDSEWLTLITGSTAERAFLEHVVGINVTVASISPLGTLFMFISAHLVFITRRTLKRNYNHKQYNLGERDLNCITGGDVRAKANLKAFTKANLMWPFRPSRVRNAGGRKTIPFALRRTFPLLAAQTLSSHEQYCGRYAA